MTPAPPAEVLPPEVFCVVGWAFKPVLEHEEYLLQQHEAGAIQLYDRGHVLAQESALRRWRMSWTRHGEPVHALLAMTDIPGHPDAVRLWAGAHCDAGWGWDVESPLIRMGLNDQTILDPASALVCTGSTQITAGDDLAQAVAVARDGHATVPVLFQHVSAGAMRWPSAFRYATFGAAAMVTLDDDAAARLAEQLPDDRRIPGRGARLYLPGWWSDQLADPTLSREYIDDEQQWRALVDTALRASRWPDPKAFHPDLWASMFIGAWNDERVAEPSGSASARWYTASDDTDKPELRQRLQGADDSVSELRAARSRRDSEAAQLRAELQRRAPELEALTKSRRTLARAVLRLRRERDAARAELGRTSVGAAVQRAAVAKRRARARSSELEAREDEIARLRSSRQPVSGPPEAGFAAAAELLAAATELGGVRLAEDVSGWDAEVSLWRCWRVLVLFSEYAGTDTESADRYLRDHGISPLLLGSVPAVPAVTFPVRESVDPAGWAPFTRYVALQHSKDIVLHYLDDTRGATGVVHIGYLGPRLLP